MWNRPTSTWRSAPTDDQPATNKKRPDPIRATPDHLPRPCKGPRFFVVPGQFSAITWLRCDLNTASAPGWFTGSPSASLG